MRYTIVSVTLLLAASLAFGHASFTGYSGAPGSEGTCAGGCHGVPGGSITVSGFPTSYTPGHAYTITVAHSGGSTISNFNGSVRVGASSTNAGTITAGTNTAVYNVSGETNGVHFANADQESGTFTWTAPSPAVGSVKLYLSGHQSTSVSGPNTQITLTASAADVAEPVAGTLRTTDFRLEQSVVSDFLVVRLSNPQAPARVRVVDRDGRIQGRWVLAPAGNRAVALPLLDNRDRKLATGSYYVIMSAAGTRRVAKFTVVAR